MSVDAPSLAFPAAESFLAAVASPLGFSAETAARVRFESEGALPAAFAVTDFASGTVGVAGLAASELIAGLFGEAPAVTVDRRLVSGWFGMSIQPVGWSLASPWDPIAGDYATSDGWIRLHTNAPHHRAAALAVLGVEVDKSAVTAAVRKWRADELEAAVVARGGCAATLRSLADWAFHPQGRAVATEPVVIAERGGFGEPKRWAASRGRPLAGLRVLDCTRVLAGPVATRFLAGLGADVLRIDPPDWDEPAVIPEVTLGKRCARLDIKSRDGRAQFEKLLGDADAFVHGLRPGALDALGLGAEEREKIRPGLVDVSLDAYGWSGPWAGRRGFDSLVQMSAGIADEGMRVFGTDRPKPLPVQALDHAAGYVMAASVLGGLALRLADGRGFFTRTSLARMAGLLASTGAGEAPAFAPFDEADLAPETETTAWGPARRLKPPVEIEGAPLRWALPASPLGSAEPEWRKEAAVA